MCIKVFTFFLQGLMHCSKSICFVLGLLSQTGCTIPLVKTCRTVNQITLNTTVINGKNAAVINANWVTKQLVSFLCPTTETKTIPIIISLWQSAPKLMQHSSDWLYQYSSPVTTFSTCSNLSHIRLCILLFASYWKTKQWHTSGLLLLVLMNDLPFNY